MRKHGLHHQPSTRGAPLRRAVVVLMAVLGGLVISLGVRSGSALASGEGLQGTLRNNGAPVPGVVITATTADGAPVGTATSGPDGKWSIPVPGGGEYKVTIDVKTLPKGVVLVNSKQETLTPTV